MKNRGVILVLLSMLSHYAYSQKLESIKLHSSYIQDSVSVKVWLPDGYKPENKYPVIYEFIYDHSNFIATTLQNMWSMPDVIVVYAEIQGGNDHYSSPFLTDVGQKYYAFVKNELIDHITSHYHTTYRIAMGLSQGADYVNYILRNDPQLFNSYAIFSIERPIYYKADFKTYTSKITNKTSYFIAIANDMEERVDFANQLYDSLKISPRISIKKEYYPNSEHSYGILYALPDALSFIFEDYSIFRGLGPNEKISDYYNSVLSEKIDKYGGLNYGLFIIELGDLLDAANSTPSEINSLVMSINDNDNSHDLDLFNLGVSLLEAGFYDDAEKSFRLSLKKQEEKESRMNTTSIYYWLSTTYENRGENAKALEILVQGNEKTKDKKDGFLQYKIGVFKIEKGIDVKDGINDLKALMLSIKQNALTTFISNDVIYSKIARGYLMLKDKKHAQENCVKALEINPANEEANELQKAIK